MRTLKIDYQTPQIIDQGSAITKTAATTSGSCWDGSPFTDDTCPCSGGGTSCKPGDE
jgi:hypothetical protein